MSYVAKKCGQGKDSEARSCFACVSNSREELMDSSSGGVFSILANAVIDNGGVVYGHAFVDGLRVACVRIDSKDDLSRLRGSKYVQSEIGDAMRLVKDDLLSGKEVLFSGTPCQIDGLKTLIHNDSDQLLTVDIVCHGVPSQQFFLDCMAEEFGDAIDKIQFRDKKEGWGKIGSVILSRFGFRRSRLFSPQNSLFYSHFNLGDCYRESCYRCPYAGMQRPGDLTIGDFWGLDFVDAGLDSSSGISMVIVNTPAGEQMSETIRERSRWAERPLEEAIAGNTQLRHPATRPSERDTFLKEWREGGAKPLVSAYRRQNAARSTIWIIRRKLRRVIKRIISR